MTLQQEQYLTPLEDLVKKLFKRFSVVIFIKGRRETGKTDLSLLIAEIVYTNCNIDRIATNIDIFKSPFPIEHITNLEDLTSYCKLSTKRKLFIFDELGKAMRRRTPMSKLNIEILDKLQTLRKYQLSIIEIAPADFYVDNATLGSDVLDVVIDKYKFKNPKVADWLDVQELESYPLINLPRTIIDFDTYSEAPFTLKSPTRIAPFSDKDKALIWEWTQGKTINDLGLRRMEWHRILKKFLKETLERERTT